jgi:hypothetical protein
MSSRPGPPLPDARAQGEQVAHSDPFEWFARAGLAARGVVYVLMGWLAVKVATTGGGETANQQEVLKEIAQQDLGKVLLVLTAVGLAGYATWRLLRAALGHGPEDSDGTFDRLGGLVSGIGYGLLCATAVGILIGAGGGDGGDEASQTTGGVLGWTGGVVLVFVFGAATIFEGLDQGYKAVSRKFLEKSKTAEMSSTVKTWFTRIGVFGHLARMVVFVLIGYFLCRAALDYDAKEAVSLDGALSKLAQADYGPWLLGVVAFGLIGFGLYSLADARYRKV